MREIRSIFKRQPNWIRFDERKLDEHRLHLQRRIDNSAERFVKARDAAGPWNPQIGIKPYEGAFEDWSATQVEGLYWNRLMNGRKWLEVKIPDIDIIRRGP
jgi:hypothetical protein